MKFLTITALVFLSVNTYASTAELLKAAIDAADKAGMTDIKSISETKMYRCVKCYEFEVKGYMPAAPDMDATARVVTSGTMPTTEHPNAVTNANVAEIKLTPKPQPPTEDDSDDRG